MREEYVELATEIIEDELANIMNVYAVTKNEEKTNVLKQKIGVLQQIKTEISKGNSNIIKMVLQRKKKGII